MALHWDPTVERRGLGKSVMCVNHIALIVEDVGRSASFYSDVLGLQQIKRPNFDRHGAWFTMGNCELHLIKGAPLVHDGTNLIVCHISLEVENVEVVFQRLKDMNIPFEQNVSVPRGAGKAASEGGNLDNTLTQYFIRDPDGYYIEICNCGILTDFCLGKSNREFEGYAEGVTCSWASLTAGTKLGCIARQARRMLKRRPPFAEFMKSVTPAEVADGKLLTNLTRRRLVYGDICQSFSESELEEILKEAGNSAPTAILIMQHRLKNKGQKGTFIPPSYVRHSSNSSIGEMYKPSAIKHAVSASTESSS